jgi:hypothetical protein
MHSTLKLRESDPHDVFAIAPDTVPLAWADKVIADIARDANQPSSDQQPPAGSSAAVAAPTVDTNFRATTVNDLHVANDRPVPPPSTGSGAKSKVAVFLFALCSGLAAAAWQHYGGAAKQMISDWSPPFTLTSSPPTETTGLTDQPDTPAVQVSSQAPAADQAPPQDASAAQPSEATAPAAAAPSPDAAQLQSMARDVAAMGAQIEQLKASIAELRASQQAMALAKPSDAKASEIKPSETKPLMQNPRPKMPAPPRPIAAPVRRPMAAYPPVQASAPPPLPQQLPPAALQQPAPPPPAQFDGDEPVMRPPMPLR